MLIHNIFFSFIAESEILSFIIGVRHMEQRKTSENIKAVLADIWREWGTDTNSSRLIAVITDRGANVKKSRRELFGAEQ